MRSNPVLSAVLILAGALFVAGCSSDKMPKYQSLGGFRVLAIQATPPEVAPGNAVTLTALLSDIGGQGRKIRYTIEACPDPGISFGADASCTDFSQRTIITTSGEVDPTSPRFTTETAAANFTVPASALDGKNALEIFNGVTYIVVFNFRTDDGISQKAIKRVTVTSAAKAVKNSNPVLTDLNQEEGSVLGSLPSATTTVLPAISSSSNEIYSTLSGTGTLENATETLTTTWFTSDGSFSQTRTENLTKNSFNPPSVRPSGRSIVLVLVTRDSRGGESYIIKSY